MKDILILLFVVSILVGGVINDVLSDKEMFKLEMVE